MTTQASTDLLSQAQAAKAAARKLAGLSTTVKNRALEAIAEALVARQDEILAANAQDVERARDAGLADAPLNRLRLTPEKIAAIAERRAHRRQPARPRGRGASTASACPTASSQPPPRAPGRAGRDLREPAQRDHRYRLALPQVRQRLRPSRRQRGDSLQHGAGPRRARGRDRSRRAGGRPAAHREHGPRPGRRSC